MDSRDLAQYIETVDGLHKPWLLAQLRLKKLQERRSSLSDADYVAELAQIQDQLAQLGDWWVGREDEVFRQGR
ncbi:MAG: hypothetical protein EA395_10000 [Phormidium sp. GEM2.Bin31]|nr:hypothetical protein [Phormidium sp. BM_Day4_Bin.17]TVR09528.1 MAG: hypothetical protein EA395_10000 [Phormidium sp. GEM2.Bin31]UCJ13520.1 MAG: hypothetical protein JWS08_07080 [Phormidium sp. PBR-2020]